MLNVAGAQSRAFTCRTSDPPLGYRGSTTSSKSCSREYWGFQRERVDGRGPLCASTSWGSWHQKAKNAVTHKSTLCRHFLYGLTAHMTRATCSYNGYIRQCRLVLEIFSCTVTSNPVIHHRVAMSAGTSKMIHLESVSHAQHRAMALKTGHFCVSHALLYSYHKHIAQIWPVCRVTQYRSNFTRWLYCSSAATASTMALNAASTYEFDQYQPCDWAFSCV